MNVDEAVAAWRADRPRFERLGIHFPDAKMYIPDGWKDDLDLAMDAMPPLVTDPNAALPSLFTTMVDPTIFRVALSPNEAVNIMDEVKKGDWTDDSILFPVIEHTGETTSYDDYAEGGSSGINANWPARQSYVFQTMKRYGERELDRAAKGKIGLVSEIDESAAIALDKFLNVTYFFGVANLQNYGLLNDPLLSGALTPSIKANGGTGWIKNGAINAQANEIYADIEAMFLQLTAQTAGRVKRKDKLLLCMSPTVDVAMTATNTFNVNVSDILKKSFPNIEVQTAMQYGQTSATNPQGITAGNLVQMIAKTVDGQQTGFCAFNEKMRAHKLITYTSSYRQKMTGGTWGTVLRFPAGISQMIGV